MPLPDFHTLAEQQRTDAIIGCCMYSALSGGSPSALLNEQSRGLQETIAHIAVRTDNRPLLAWLLLIAGINLNLQDNEGNTPLHRAFIIGNLPAISIIINAQWQYLSTTLTRVFLNPFIKNNEGKTARDCALVLRNRYANFKARLYMDHQHLHAAIREQSSHIIYSEGDSTNPILRENIGGREEIVIRFHDRLYCLIGEDGIIPQGNGKERKGWAYVYPADIIQAINVLTFLEQISCADCTDEDAEDATE